jgi:hypothetical protein
MIKYINNNIFWICFIFITIPFIFWMLLGYDSYILIWDNLDITFITIEKLFKSENIFSSSPEALVYGSMNGIPRIFYPSILNLFPLLIYFFGNVKGYIFGRFLVHIIAFVGMNLFLKRYILRENNFIVCMASLVFASIPFHASSQMAVAMMPLMFFAFLNLIYREKIALSFLIILIYSFSSFILFTTPFLLFFLSLIGIYFKVYKKENVFLFIYGMFFYLFLSLISEYQLLISFFDSTHISHRIDIVQLRGEDIGLPSFIEMLRSSIYNFVYTLPHPGRILTIPIFISAFYLILRINFDLFSRNKFFNEENRVLFLLLLILLPIISLWVGFYPLISNEILGKISLRLSSIDLSRFSFTLPFLWITLFAISLNVISKDSKFGQYLCLLLVGSQIYFNLSMNTEFKNNLKILTNHPISEPTFKEFIANDVFNLIKNDIGSSGFNVASIGMHPSVSQMNGFSTLDSYEPNYLLTYKKKFRKIIEEELDKNDVLKSYFDSWGNRCYLWSSNLGKDWLDNAINKADKAAIKELNINYEAFKNLGGKYIFSSAKIENVNSDMIFINSYETPTSFRKIFVYEIL